jgi:hypothetical protein
MTYGPLTSISCTAPGDCTAAGLYSGSAGATRLVLLTETGGEWTKGVEPALPANGASSQAEQYPYAVSCVSPGNCGVGGSYTQSSGYTGPLLLSQRDGVWATGAEVALPAKVATHFELGGITVSCTSLENCTGAGSPLSGPVADTPKGEQGLLTAGPLQPTFMPNFKRTKLGAAMRAVKSHGCSIRNVRHAHSRSVPRGHVISQTPQPGIRLTLERRITLVVSDGRP